MKIRTALIITQFIFFIGHSEQECFRTQRPSVPINNYDYYYRTSRRNYGYDIKCNDINSNEDNEAAMEKIYSDGISASVKNITYENSYLTRLTSGMFRHFTGATGIDLHNCEVTNIELGAFNGLSSLTKLNLQGNNISSIPSGIFNSLFSLTALNLSNNVIERIDENAFLGANDLRELNISSNRISDSLSTMKTLKKLENLDLSYNLISNLGEKLEFAHLRNASFKNNQIRALNATTFLMMSHLNSLDLSNNLINGIAEDSFISLEELTKLNLRNNNIIRLPLGIFRNSTALLELDLSMNGLNYVEVGDFTGLTSLKILNLSFNKLSDLPKGIFHGIGKLQTIYIDNNYLKHIDVDDLNLLYVTAISMDYNRWCCEILADTISNLGSGKVTLGREYNSSNIHGIACTFCDSNKVEDTMSKQWNNVEQVKATLENVKSWFWRSPFVEFFQSGYKNTSFFYT